MWNLLVGRGRREYEFMCMRGEVVIFGGMVFVFGILFRKGEVRVC